MAQQLPVAAKVDEELEHAERVLADTGCDFQRLVGDLELGSRDSSADTVACDGRRDIVGIPADTAACARRMVLSEAPVDILGMHHVEANENQESRLLGDERQ